MANKRLNATITIGGAVSGAFSGALKKTDSQIGGLGKTIQGLEAKQRRFGVVANNLKSIGRDASTVTDRYREMGRQLERMRSTQQRLVSLNRASAVNQQRRGELRGQLFDAVALAGSVVAPLRAAMAEEMSQFRLGTVITDGADMAISKAKAREIARTGLANLDEAYNSQYALFSAGFNDVAARAGSQISLGVSRITGGQAEGVTEVIATAFNNLGDAMEGDAEQKLARIGDILTKTQFKFQIRDFNQLGESFKMASASMAGFNVPLEQGATLLGSLNTAGLQGSMAGTAFSAMMRNMTKAADNYGFAIHRTANGQLDMVRTLQEMNASMDMLGLTGEERMDSLQKTFGDEGARAVVPLLNGINELSDALDDVTNNSAGLVQQEVDKYLATSTAQAGAFWQQIKIVGSTIGTVLLPPMNSLMQLIGPIFQGVARLAETFPMLTTVLVAGTTALIGFRVAAIAGGYGMTFLRGGALSVLTAVTRMRAGILMNTVAMQSGTEAAAAAGGKWVKFGQLVGSAALAVKGLNIAMLANPIGLVVGALVVGGMLIYKFWQPIKAFFSGFWEGFTSGMQPIMPLFRGLASVFSPVVKLVSTLWGWFSDLLTPVQMTADGFETATSSGQRFGELVGSALRNLMAPIMRVRDGIGWIGEKLGFGDDEETEGSAANDTPANRAARRRRNAIIGASMGAASMGVPATAGEGNFVMLPENVRPESTQTTNVDGSSRTDSRKNEFNITIVQRPGENSEEFAQRTADILEERQQNNRNSALYDEVE